MTIGMFVMRVIGGLVLGVLALVFSPRVFANLGTFSLVIAGGSIPVAAVVAGISAARRTQHYMWWRSFRARAGVARYVIVNALTGAPIVAAMAFVGMFAGIVLFMAP